MGAALETTQPPKPKPSFKVRFRAWWEGTDMLEAEPEPAPPQPEPGPAEPAAAAAEAPPEPPEARTIEVAQQIWGEGFTRPGGAAAILTLVKPFALDPSMTVMDFGASMGGGTRAVSGEFNVWVNGFEPSAVIAAAAQELSVKKGAKKAEIKPYTAQDFQPKPASFDCIFSSEALYTLEEKDKLLGSFERALKARGQISITDFVRTKGTAADDKRLAGFVARTGKPTHFWSSEEYLSRFKTLKFDVRVDEDLSANWRAMVLEAWVNFTQDHAGTLYAKAHPEAMVEEVTLWTRRIAALDSGALQLRRYYAIKMGSTKV